MEFKEQVELLELEELVLGKDGEILIRKTHIVPSIKLIPIGQDFRIVCSPKYIEPPKIGYYIV